MKRALNIWLDDIRDPKEHDIQLLFGATGKEKWIQTGEEVIELLDEGANIKCISFDHDLGENRITGYDVAKEFERRCYNKEIKCPLWKIHSSNPVGADRIMQAMINAKKYSNE